MRHEGESLTVEIWGGLPVDLTDFGIDEVIYCDNPRGWTVDGHNEKQKVEADKRFQKVLDIILVTGRKPSKRTIQAEMRRLNMPVMTDRAVMERLRTYLEGVHGISDLDDHRPPPPASDPSPEPPPEVVPPTYSNLYREGEPLSESLHNDKATAGGASIQKPAALDPATLTDEEIAEALGMSPEKPKKSK